MFHNVLSAICSTKLGKYTVLMDGTLCIFLYGVSHVVTLTFYEIGTTGSMIGGSKGFTMC